MKPARTGAQINCAMTYYISFSILCAHVPSESHVATSSVWGSKEAKVVTMVPRKENVDPGTPPQYVQAPAIVYE